MVAKDEAIPYVWSEVGPLGFAVGHGDVGSLDEFVCFFLIIFSEKSLAYKALNFGDLRSWA